MEWPNGVSSGLKVFIKLLGPLHSAIEKGFCQTPSLRVDDQNNDSKSPEN